MNKRRVEEEKAFEKQQAADGYGSGCLRYPEIWFKVPIVRRRI